jgi:aryl-alcohol dehydrogenase-like predicted oxidoreductase
MNLRRLGNTDLEVTALGLGCWQFSSGFGPVQGYWSSVDQPTVNEIVAGALQGGINWFDTAELYGGGKSEQALSKALTAAGKKPGEVLVATKWMPLLRWAGNIPKTIDVRLEKLSPFGIDLYQVHLPISFSSVEEEMRQMAGLVAAKKIRAIGVSNYDAQRMRRAHAELQKHGLTLASNQIRYNLIDRGVEDRGVIAAAKELGISIIAYSPLAQGVLTGRFHDDPKALANVTRARRFSAMRDLERVRPLVDELKAIAQAHSATAAQVALAWVTQFHGETVVAIPGATKTKQLQDNVAALSLTLTTSELAALDQKSRAIAA